MSWQITEDDLAAFPAQQQLILRYELTRHLLSLPQPPTDWESCEALLSERCAQAARLNISSIDSLKMFVEALHYVPEALADSKVQDYLTCGAMERSRAEFFLNWAIRQKECAHEL